MKSDLFLKKVVNMEKSKKAAIEIKKQRKQTHDEVKAAAIHIRQSNIDETEIKTANEERDNFLHLALKYVCSSEINVPNILEVSEFYSFFLD